MKWWFGFCYLTVALTLPFVGPETSPVTEFLWQTMNSRLGVAGWALATIAPVVFSMVSLRGQSGSRHLWAQHLLTIPVMFAAFWLGSSIVVTAGGLGNEMAERTLVPAFAFIILLTVGHLVAAIWAMVTAGREREST